MTNVYGALYHGNKMAAIVNSFLGVYLFTGKVFSDGNLMNLNLNNKSESVELFIAV